MLSLARNDHSWQLILADLALILFLVSAAALSASDGFESSETINDIEAEDATVIGPAQALYRAGPGLPSLAEWLERQPRDPRASLTIVAQHRPDQEERAWTEARALAATAKAVGVRSRVIIREGEESDIHARLGYDQPTSGVPNQELPANTKTKLSARDASAS